MTVKPSPRTAVLMLVAAGVCGWRFQMQGGLRAHAYLSLGLCILLAAIGLWMLWQRFRT